jgi:hypothetical protein
MNTTHTIEKLEAQIARIKTQLQHQGPMRPGSLSRQYNVCGKAGCRCKDPKQPRRHGPYYQLNFVYRGKKSSKFIRPEILKQVKAQLANYKQFRRLTEQWIGLALHLAQAKENLPASHRRRS